MLAIVTLLQNCRYDANLWSREINRLSRLIKTEPLVQETLWKEAGMDALCELLLVTYGLDAETHPAMAAAPGPAPTAAAASTGTTASAMSAPVSRLASSDLVGLPADGVESSASASVGGGGGEREPAAAAAADPAPSKPSRLQFVREISESLLHSPWTSRSPLPSTPSVSNRQQRWLPPVFASETMAADVLTILKELIRLSVKVNRAEVLELAVQSLGCLEAIPDVRPNGLPLNLLQTYGHPTNPPNVQPQPQPQPTPDWPMLYHGRSYLQGCGHL